MEAMPWRDHVTPEWNQIWTAWKAYHRVCLVIDHQRFDDNLAKMEKHLLRLEPLPTLDELTRATDWIWLNEPEARWKTHLKMVVRFLSRDREQARRAENLESEKSRVKNKSLPDLAPRYRALFKMPELGEAY